MQFLSKEVKIETEEEKASLYFNITGFLHYMQSKYINKYKSWKILSKKRAKVYSSCNPARE